MKFSILFAAILISFNGFALQCKDLNRNADISSRLLREIKMHLSVRSPDSTVLAEVKGRPLSISSQAEATEIFAEIEQIKKTTRDKNKIFSLSSKAFAALGLSHLMIHSAKGNYFLILPNGNHELSTFAKTLFENFGTLVEFNPFIQNTVYLQRENSIVIGNLIGLPSVGKKELAIAQHLKNMEVREVMFHPQQTPEQVFFLLSPHQYFRGMRYFSFYENDNLKSRYPLMVESVSRLKGDVRDFLEGFPQAAERNFGKNLVGGLVIDPRERTHPSRIIEDTPEQRDNVINYLSGKITDSFANNLVRLELSPGSQLTLVFTDHGIFRTQFEEELQNLLKQNPNLETVSAVILTEGMGEGNEPTPMYLSRTFARSKNGIEEITYSFDPFKGAETHRVQAPKKSTPSLVRSNPSKTLH